MINLLKADFYRLIKNKTSLIGLIIAVGMGLFMPFALYGFKSSMNNDTPVSILGGILNLDILISTLFSFSNNFGLVIPVFIGIITVSDFSHGTIRNKITLGYNRHKIFASTFIVNAIYSLLLIIVYAGLCTVVGGLLLGFPEIVEGATFTMQNYVFHYVLGVISFLFVVAVTTCFGFMTNSIPGTIVTSVGLCLLIGLVTSVLGTVLAFVSFESEILNHLICFIPSYGNAIFNMGGMDKTAFIEGLAGVVILGSLFYLLGTFVFAKKDLK